MQPKAARNISIEALRLVAVAGIAIFHTFQWTFQAVCTGLPEYAPLAAFPYSGALGFINLLGCWANEVFFMISGYFLIPSAVRALQNGSSAQGLTLKSLDRLKKIVLPTLFYCATCLFVSMYVYPLPEISLHEIGWLTLGIEFIWVYAASVLLVPVIALMRQRIGSKRAPFVVALLTFTTFGINCCIAATANEAAGIILWRKLMSAVTYLVAFIAAGEMRFVLECHGNASGAQYAVQSFTCNVWRPIFDKAIYAMATGIQTGESHPAGAILLGILMSLCLALSLLLVDIVRRAVVESIKARMNG